MTNSSALNSNSRAGALVTPDTVQKDVAQARNSYTLSKDSAAKAAAHVYMVWRDTQAPSASKTMREWFVAEVKELNAEIDKFNAELAVEKDRAKRYANNTLKKSDPAALEPKDDEERQAVAAERTKLAKLSGRTDKEWDELRKVRIDARNDASPFTLIVKYVLGFDRRADASVTSRYATVLEWVDSQFCSKVIESADEIVAAITVAGGFEDVLREQRGTQDTAESDDEAEDRRIQAQAIVDQAKAAISRAPAKAVFNMSVKHSPSGIVSLLGRYVDGRIEVVGELPVDEQQLDRTVAMFNDEALLPTHDRSEFIARVLALGDLVSEGEKSKQKTDGLQCGALLKAERVVSVLPSLSNRLQIVVSARYADSSVIVKASFAKQGVEMGAPSMHVTLPIDNRKALDKMIRNRETRRFVDVIPGAEGNSFHWVATDSALLAKSRSNARRIFCFEDMEPQAHKPLDVDGFKPQFTVTLTASELRKLYDQRLADWAKDMSGKKGSKLMTLHFADGAIVHKVDGAADLALEFGGAMKGAHALQFRPRDLHDLVKTLLAQPCDVFKVAGDTGGLLGVTWSDLLGVYEVYVPTATSEGALSTKRVEPMRCETVFAQAA